MQLEADALRKRYVKVRSFSEQLCEPLYIEDYTVQSMPDASPTKWHLAHTTWFFDQFILQDLCGQDPYHEQYNYLFNSYYNGAGDQYRRECRGMITRPGVGEVYEYRNAIDDELQGVIAAGNLSEEFALRLEIGLNHEQQHQELLLTDLKHLLWQNPLRPALFNFEHEPFAAERKPTPDQMPRVSIDGGIFQIGHAPDEGGPDFSYDNERPRHDVLLRPFELARRPVDCGEYLQFMEDGGYEDHRLWLSDGWTKLHEEGWNSPLYWEKRDGAWHVYTLSGLRPVQPNEPVVHVSFYEAQAFAEWAGARLPDEREWEVAAQDEPVAGNFVESGNFHPKAVEPDPKGFNELFGDVWEWTSSDYGPYPGFEPFEGNLGEYNGKFMCNQYVLRGGSCATSKTHIRPTYRNFFYPGARWQFSGIRLAW